MTRILVLLAGLWLSTASFAQAPVARLQPLLQGLLDSIVEANPYPGATLAIVLKDGSRISLASGWADKEEKVAMLPGAMMPAGSTGKTFVAALALRAIFEKDIDLDTPIEQWLGAEDWFSRLPNGPDITLGMLMSHRSGLPRYVFDEGFLAALQADPEREWEVVEQLEFILDQPPIHPVGEAWAYSDTNYLIIGLLLEKWTGRSYYDLLREEILDPFSLAGSRAWNKPFQPGLAPGYVGEVNPLNMPAKVGLEERYPVNPQFEYCGGGVISNSTDLASWMWVLHRGDVLPGAAYEAMIKAFDLQTGQKGDSGYGLGTFVWDTPMGLTYSHPGFFPGYGTIAQFNKDKGFALAIQVNTDQGLGRELPNHLVEVSEIIQDTEQKIQQEDEAGIRENLRLQAECWNKGDIRCYMQAYYASDSLRMISGSGVKQGYQDILQRYIDTYPPDNMGHLRFDLLHLNKLRPDLYFMIGRYNLQRDEGPAMGYFSVLMQKIEGVWYMISDHSSSG